MRKVRRTGQVLRTWNSFSCKVGCTLEEMFIKRRFRPMIGFLRSTCTTCHLEGKVPVVAIYIGHQGSTKGKVGVQRSFLSVGGT